MFSSRPSWLHLQLDRLTTILHGSILLFNIVAILPASETISTQGWGTLVLAVLEYVPVFILTPRFIISIRHLYASGATEDGLRDIDTGFGLSTLAARRGAGRSAIVFAEDGEELERGDEIGMDAY